MSWGSNLALEVEAEFEGLDRNLGYAPHLCIVDGRAIYNIGMVFPKPDPKPKIKTRTRETEIRRKRKARLKKQILAWQTPAMLILLGRDLPTDRWIEVLTNPVSDQEVEAFADFCYFLRHKGVHRDQICGMLSCSVEEMEAALRYRK